MSTYLDSCLERQEGVPRIAHLENASESVLGQVANLEDFQIRRHGAEVELGHDNVIDDDGRLRRLVQGRRQEIAGALVEARVGRQRRPVEVEGHVELAFVLEMHRSQRGWTGQARRRGGGRYFSGATARVGTGLRIAVGNAGRVGADARGQMLAMQVGRWRWG